MDLCLSPCGPVQSLPDCSMSSEGIAKKKKTDTMSTCNGATEECDTLWYQKSRPFQTQSHGVNINNTSRHLKYFHGLILKTKVYEMSVGICAVELYAQLLWGHLFEQRLRNAPRSLLHTTPVIDSSSSKRDLWPETGFVSDVWREHWRSRALHRSSTAVLSRDGVRILSFYSWRRI